MAIETVSDQSTRETVRPRPNSQDQLDIVLLGLGNQVLDLGGTSLVEQRLSDFYTLDNLLEGESHSSADDERVDLKDHKTALQVPPSATSYTTPNPRPTHLIQHVVNQLNLVLNLGTSEDGKERPLGGLERLGEELQLLLHQEPGGSLGQLNTDHGRVSSVGSTERVVDVDRSELGQRLSESLDSILVGLDLFAFRVLAATFLLGVESKVLEQKDLALGSVLDGLLGLGANTIRKEGDRLAKELGQLVGL